MAQDEQTARAMLAQTKYTNELLAKPGVVGVGVGLLSGGGVGLVVMVDKVTAEVQAAVPSELDGVPVEVRETGALTAF